MAGTARRRQVLAQHQPGEENRRTRDGVRIAYLPLATIVSDGMDGLLNFQGGLMSWVPDLENQYKMATYDVDKILKGANPGDLPITHPPNCYLTIYADTAQGWT